jgi:dTDP-4-amino-4,6-dideoxygalactose transaminase
VAADLERMGVQTMVYYPVPCHRLKLYQESHAGVRCPVAESLATEVLSLPIWPEITPEVQKAVADALKASV